MTASFSVRRAAADELPLCLHIRRRVFIEEQGVTEALEVDGLDGEALHYLAFLRVSPSEHIPPSEPIGTARVRFPEAGLAKIQRVAVLSVHRGTGVGLALMQGVIDDLSRRHHIGRMTLGSQLTAVPFYKRLGFEERGEHFLDAGIEHVEMVRVLNGTS